MHQGCPRTLPPQRRDPDGPHCRASLHSLCFTPLVVGSDEPTLSEASSAPPWDGQKPQTASSSTSIGAVVPPGGQHATHLRRTEYSAPESCAQLGLRAKAPVRGCRLLCFCGNRQATPPDTCGSQLQVGCLISPALASWGTWTSVPGAILRVEDVVVLPFQMGLRSSFWELRENLFPTSPSCW